MFQNMGVYDRLGRVIVGLVLGGLYFAGVLQGTVAIVLAVVAVVLIGTSAVGFCPAYLPFKFSTKTKS
ncbi:hypothetical protein LPTSP4_28920 [Leptospira ryugenii]|uniref:Inner membrane protein YgaP-like transmembrane domain-containing protein n=1 Tax=Leptospira ryugenii TaxID=1917863 RepID=A0A2P2E3F1_9LEPT|nr:DUF2892 domain-containing protein [Leptospira ryugenii]GBF51356.1 hypothetical protein LPTSP4_28920 [Leptospira ryugenii]